MISKIARVWSGPVTVGFIIFLGLLFIFRQQIPKIDLRKSVFIAVEDLLKSRTSTENFWNGIENLANDDGQMNEALSRLTQLDSADLWELLQQRLPDNLVADAVEKLAAKEALSGINFRDQLLKLPTQGQRLLYSQSWLRTLMLTDPAKGLKTAAAHPLGLNLREFCFTQWSANDPKGAFTSALATRDAQLIAATLKNASKEFQNSTLSEAREELSAASRRDIARELLRFDKDPIDVAKLSQTLNTLGLQGDLLTFESIIDRASPQSMKSVMEWISTQSDGIRYRLESALAVKESTTAKSAADFLEKTQSVSSRHAKEAALDSWAFQQGNNGLKGWEVASALPDDSMRIRALKGVFSRWIITDPSALEKLAGNAYASESFVKGLGILKRQIHGDNE